MDPDDLTPPERDAFRALPTERAPRREIEDAIVSALKRRGALEPRRRGWLVPALATAATIIVAFTIGFRIGAQRATAAPPAPGARYMLLLYEGPSFQNPAPGRELERVAEYSAWARGLTSGRLLGGEELAASARVLTGGADAPPIAADRDVRGYFTIAAPDERAAAEIAQTCPHLKYGGTIALKPIIDH